MLPIWERGEGGADEETYQKYIKWKLRLAECGFNLKTICDEFRAGHMPDGCLAEVIVKNREQLKTLTFVTTSKSQSISSLIDLPLQESSSPAASYCNTDVSRQSVFK